MSNNSNSGKVAVITRSKDRPVFLKRAIQSVLSQSYKNWIHVIVNDGGIPSEVETLTGFYKADYDNRLKIIHHETSKGMQHASNSGIKSSGSEFIVIHDDDDSWHPDFLSKCVHYMERNDDGQIQGVVAQTNQVLEEVCVDGTIRKTGENPYYPFSNVGISDMRRRNLFAPIAFLYRRDVHDKIGFFRQEFDVLGDYDFNLRFLRFFEIGVIPEFLANYHWRHGSLGNTVTRARNVHRKMLCKLKNTCYRELLDDPKSAIGDIFDVEMPPSDDSRTGSFSKRESEPPAPLPMPDFLKNYEFKVLSLDVFDTALRRKCNRPKDVFILLQDRARGWQELEGIPIALARVEAEELARRIIRPEIDLGEIYQVMKEACHLSREVTDNLMSLELEIEKEMLYADPQVLKLYSDCRKAGKRVIFISDMYLPSAVIAGFLKAAGYSDPEVYVSCELKKSKHVGDLQQEVAGRFDLDPQEILHLGDNYHSDCLRCWQAGWNAFHWSEAFLYKPWYAQVDPYYYNREDFLSARIMGEVSRLGSEWAHERGSLLEKLGIEAAGPLYLSFMLWAADKAKADGIRKLFLLGRDGYYWQKTLEEIAQHKSIQFEFTYIHSSRKVLNFASFRSLEKEAIDFLSTPNPALSVRDFVARTGIDPDKHLKQFEQAGFSDPEQIITTPMGGDFVRQDSPGKLKNLFLLLEKELLEQFHNDQMGIQTVLQEEGFDPSDCAIVDIGWNASSAYSLSRMYQLEIPECLRGYYFGTWQDSHAGPHPVNLKSYFVDAGSPPENANLVRESVNLIESLNAAPYPTLSAYKSVSGKPEPQFSPELKSGFSVKQQSGIWSGAQKFLKSICRYLPSHVGDCPGHSYLQLMLKRLLMEPSLREIEEWGELLHSEGFGLVSHTPLIHKVEDDVYGEELMKAYWSSNWKRGFLATLTEEKCKFVQEHARPVGPRSREQLIADLQWKNKQVDLFWQEKESHKVEIKKLKKQIVELREKLESLKTDFDWKSGEAHALLMEKESLRKQLDELRGISGDTEAHG